MDTHTTLMSESAVADLLGVATRTVRRLRHDDPSFPPAVRITARIVRYRQADVERWVASKQDAPAPDPKPAGRRTVVA